MILASRLLFKHCVAVIVCFGCQQASISQAAEFDLMSTESQDYGIAVTQAQTPMRISEMLWAIVFDDGIQAFAGSQWLPRSDTNDLGFFIQRQPGAVSLQYRF